MELLDKNKINGRSVKILITVLVSLLFGLILSISSPFYAMLFFVIILVPFLIAQPGLFLSLFISILILFSNVAYGLKNGSQAFNIYEKGTGVLPVPLVEFCILGLILSAIISLTLNQDKLKLKWIYLDLSIAIFILASFIYMFFSFIVGKESLSVEGLRGALSSSGVINVFNFGTVYFCFNLIVSNKNKLLNIVKLITVLAGFRAVFGIFRFLFQGGDPANFYANFERVNIKITFFDIYDSAFFIFATAFFFLCFFICSDKRRFPVFLILLFVLNIMLSFRRTAWIGLVMAFYYLLGKARKKIQTLGVFLLVFLVLLSNLFISARFGSFAKFFHDLSFDFTSTSKMARLGELFYAVKTVIIGSPLLGLGVQGQYSAPSIFNEGPSPDYVHSAPVHIFLKMGLLGLILFSSLLFGIFRMNYSVKHMVLNNNIYLPIYYSACTTLIFLIPDIAFGTPLIEFRHAVGLGFFLAIARCSFNFMQQNINKDGPINGCSKEF